MADSTNLKNFPFKSVLNLRLLIEFWERSLQSGQMPHFSQGILEQLKQVPELKEPIEDLTLIEKHKSLIRFLISAVIPPANWDHELSAAVVPFQFQALFSTKAFDNALPLDRIHELVRVNIPGNQLVIGKTIQACLMILSKYYNADIKFDKPILFTIKNQQTGLDKVYKVEMNRQFLDVICKTEPRPIDKHILKFLIEKVYDVDLWLQYIRPEDYEFHGFMVMRLVDVTEEEMLSSIKYDLLKKDAVSRPESFEAIQHKLRSIFGLPEIMLGLAYFDPNNNLILNNSSVDCWKSLAESNQGECDYSGSVYERSWMEQRYVTVENLEEYPYKSKVEKSLLENGIKNILLAPLVDDGETIGMLELATPTPGLLNPVSANKVENVLPLFTVAVKRVKNEMETEVRAIIQEECTAIHPVVQWRFFEAGVNLMNQRRRGEEALLEEIFFKDVYPLFGMVDVRNSSLERSAAIQKDLQENLKMAKDLLQQISFAKNLPLIDEIIYKIVKHLGKIDHGLASGDESNVLEFLKGEVNSALGHFETDEVIREWIEDYKSKLDPVFGVVYKRRKAFEESLDSINKTICTYLDEAEEGAQAMFPHYFEKYKTDGVEFTLYMGSALVKDKIFDPFYLRNFRLWQLLTMCEIDRKINDLRPKLKTKLEVTQLILVHDQPLSIRFRPDEKQFDVDGAYDIRYEIVKKRIDKAYIKNTGERLTQPGKIAVVYNQSKIEEEYKRYFQYLADKKIITSTVEDLELEELPGANGLRAMRIEVAGNQKLETFRKDDLLRNIEEALEV